MMAHKKEELRGKDQQQGCGVFKEGAQKPRQTQMRSCDSQGRASTDSAIALDAGDLEHHSRQMRLLKHEKILRRNAEIPNIPDISETQRSSKHSRVTLGKEQRPHECYQVPCTVMLAGCHAPPCYRTPRTAMLLSQLLLKILSPEVSRKLQLLHTGSWMHQELGAIGADIKQRNW